MAVVCFPGHDGIIMGSTGFIYPQLYYSQELLQQEERRFEFVRATRRAGTRFHRGFHQERSDTVVQGSEQDTAADPSSQRVQVVALRNVLEPRAEQNVLQ